MKTLDWHYTRDKDAERYLYLFDIGITNAIALLAGKGYGKTEFLLRDVKSIAEKKGYRVIYCSFESKEENPASALISSIETETSKKSFFKNLANVSKHKVQKASVTNDPITQLSSKLHSLARDSRRTVFLFDEITHLSSDYQSSLTGTLRTALDRHSHKLCAIYCSTWASEISTLFQNPKSPMYIPHKCTN